MRVAMETTTLRQVRENSGLSLRKAAEGIGITHAYLSALELGHKPLRAELAERLAHFYGIEDASALVQPLPEDRERFVLWLREQVKWWDSRFVLPRIPAVTSLIRDLYVPPQVLDDQGSRRGWQDVAIDFFNDEANRAILLTGPIGSGKSVLLRMLTLETEGFGRGLGGTQAYVPLLVSLGTFRLRPGSLVQSLTDYYLENGFRGAAQQLERFFEQCIGRGNALLLFDGLDEIEDYRLRAETLALLQRHFEAVVRPTGSKLIISGQEEAFVGQDARYDGFRRCRLERWTVREVQLACKRWTWESDAQAETFWLVVQANDTLFALAQWPLLFHLLTTLYSAFGLRPFQELSGLCDACCEVLENSWAGARLTFQGGAARSELPGHHWLKWRHFLIYLMERYLDEKSLEADEGIPHFSRSDMQDAWESFLVSRGVERNSLEFSELGDVIGERDTIGPLFLRRRLVERDGCVDVVEEFVFLDAIFGAFYLAKALMNNPESLEAFIVRHLRTPAWRNVLPLAVQELGRSDRRYENALGRRLVTTMLATDDEIGLDRRYGIGHFGTFTAMRSISSYNLDPLWQDVVEPFVECFLTSEFERDVGVAFRILGEYGASPAMRKLFTQKFAALQRGDASGTKGPEKWRLLSALAKLGVEPDYVANEVECETALLERRIDALTMAERVAMRRLFWSLRQVGRLFSLEEDSSEKPGYIRKIRTAASSFATIALRHFEDSLRSEASGAVHLWDVLCSLLGTQEHLHYHEDLSVVVNQAAELTERHFERVYEAYPDRLQYNQFLKVCFYHSHLLAPAVRCGLIDRYRTLAVDGVVAEREVLLTLLEAEGGIATGQVSEEQLYRRAYSLDDAYSLGENVRVLRANAASGFPLHPIELGTRLSLVGHSYLQLAEAARKDDLLELIQALLRTLDHERGLVAEREQGRYFTRPFTSYGVPLYDHLFNVISRLAQLLPLAPRH
ncbi:MAG: helix-turn-helix domain-containing protein [Bdellovibrionales bacterium]|nr:helix-turn-helix domain-containing protein [Bdellovibrionales bacterium]